MDSSLRTAAQQALAWLERETPFTMEEALETEENLRVALRAALAEPVQEPVAWFHTDFGSLELSRVQRVGWKPLYAAPPQRKPLTEEEIDSIWDSEKAFADIYAITRAIERAHGIGGNDE